MQSQYTIKDELPDGFEYLQGRPILYFFNATAAKRHLEAKWAEKAKTHKVFNITDTAQQQDIFTRSNGFSYWDDDLGFGLAFWLLEGVDGDEKAKAVDVVNFMEGLVGEPGTSQDEADLME